MWKSFVRLALICLIFLTAFSGLWAYSANNNSPSSFNPQVELHIHNKTSTFVDCIFSFNSSHHIASYGNGGTIFFYDGLKFNSSLAPGNWSLTILINTSNPNVLPYTCTYNFTSSQTTGQIGLSLTPGYYTIQLNVSVNVGVASNLNLTQAFFPAEKNVSGEFIATLVKPDVTVFTYPAGISAGFTVLFSVISIADYWRKFSR